MSDTQTTSFACLTALTLLLGQNAFAAEPVGSAFNYQGFLQEGGQPADGQYDMRFTLHDQAAAGTQVAGPLLRENVAVANGLFMTTLDFGAGALGTNALWLEIAVRPGDDAGSFTVLTPRQALLPVPFAIRAGTSAAAAFATNALTMQWGGLGGMPVGFADGIDNDTAYSAGSGLVLTGTQFALAPGGVGTAALADGSVTGGKLAPGSVTSDKLALSSYSNVFWQINGNAGTIPGTHFVGTTDAKALELRVNSVRAFRLEPDATAPNLIGGAANNTVATSTGAVISGGRDNSIADCDYAVIDGGAHNLVTNADYAVIPGGRSNVVSADLAFAAGLQACATNTGSFVWSDAAGFPFASTVTNQFRVRAVGGAEFVTAATRDAVAASVRMSATGGVAVAALSATQPALDLTQGFIRVAGASERTNSPVFIHRVTAANSGDNWSLIDHPLCNGDPAAVLLVTPNLNPNDPAGTNRVANLTAVGVFYTGNKDPRFTGAKSNRWGLYFTDPTTVAFNATFNVVVIKP